MGPEFMIEHDLTSPVGVADSDVSCPRRFASAIKKYSSLISSVVALAIVVIVCSGCASYRARKHLEGVAKGWCETIRASQVIPVYPLTEDLMPGDVFLVQTTIESQASLYRKRGFLSLDDHRTRLKGIPFDQLYFDSYWKDSFGLTPHPRISRPNPSPIPPTGSPPALTDAPAPRAAFPTYTFAAKSGFGLSLAIPVHGVPVGLNFLRTDRVNGSVTIADARTYAADELDLYHRLKKWADQDDVLQVLSETVEKAGNRPIFLRTISRVYLTGGVIVSLNRAESTGASVKAGTSPPPVNMVDVKGDVNANYEKVLEQLNKQANPVTALKDVGGAVNFIGVSESTVALAESFDRLLVIGYLGFDVPVYHGGDIGAPIPTFDRLNRTIPDPPRVRAGPLTTEQARFRVSQDALEALVKAKPSQALIVINDMLDHLEVGEFDETRKAFKVMQATRETPDGELKLNALLISFKEASLNYVTIAGNRGPRYARYDEVFVHAYDKKDKKT
jgi:hypothetical protein